MATAAPSEQTPPDSTPREPGPLHGALDKVTRPPILSLFAGLYAVPALLVGLVFVLGLTGPLSPTGQVVPGDYMAFRTGAQILADGGPLYDLDLQQAVQNGLAGAQLADWQPYVNPPLLAAVMLPLVALPYVQGFYVYAAAMVVVGVLASLALVSLAPRLASTRLHAVTLVLLVLGFHPIVRTMFGGQNTVLTWSLVTLALWALQRGRPVLCGILLGVLSYKPQYLLLLLGLLLYVRAWRGLAVALAGCLAHYGVGAALLGLDWPLAMLATMRVYRPLEWAANVGTHFSLVPFFDALVGGRAAALLAAAGNLAVLVALLRRAPRTLPGHDDFPLAWALAVVAGMLTSPHLQYYDFGVLALPVVVGIDEALRRGWTLTLPFRLTVAVIYVGYPWFATSADTLGFQPLTLWLLAVFVALCIVSRAPAAAPVPAVTRSP